MATIAATASPARSEKTGLEHWMSRVLEECDRVQRDFSEDAVHDLRAALRRCRSIADSVAEIAPHRNWGRMKRASRRLFRSLARLRDAQVMAGWVRKLAGEDDALARELLSRLSREERLARSKARAALERFDRKSWRRWSERLPGCLSDFPLDGLIFQQVAVERWEEARELDRRARRSRSRVGWHRLRIGLKRFRYVVENFLPARHAEWGKDLKEMQDLLGDVHDLDVLRKALREIGSSDPVALERWEQVIEAERAQRLRAYRRPTSGAASLWTVWRADLLRGSSPHHAE